MDSDIPSHFRAQLIALMTELFLIGSGFTIYLILTLFCLRFLIFGMSDRASKSRTVLLAFIAISIVAVCVRLIGSYADESVLIFCALDSNTPLLLCDNGQVDKAAFRRGLAITVSQAILYVLADGMLYYRAIIIWQRNFWIIVLCGLLLAGTEGFQIFSQVVAYNGQSSLAIAAASNWLSTSYDICISGLIIGKLIQYRRNAKVAEREESIAIYTSLVTVFFEASLLLSSTRIMNATFTILEKPYLYAFWGITLLDTAAAISPLFIILRLALNSFNDPYKTHQLGPGKAVRREEAGAVESSMIFAAPTGSRGPSRTDVLTTLFLGSTNTRPSYPIDESGDSNGVVIGADGRELKEIISLTKTMSSNEDKKG